MGLIKAFTEGTLSYVADMWEDYIYCDSLDNDTLIRKGRAKNAPGAGGRADENVITQDSKIAVNEGQALIIVEDGRILDFTTEQGGYVYDSNTEPSAFTGDFGDAIKVSFEQIQTRFTFGGRAGKDQRAYFVNTKEILNNRFGFGQVPYRDSEFDLTITLQGYGSFSFRIADPLIFYTNLSGNVRDSYQKSTLEPQIRAELQDAILPALSELAREGVRYDELPANVKLLTQVLRDQTRMKWRETRGIEIATIAFSNILPDEESMDKIRDLQESRIYSGNKAMLGARVGAAQANAMESAAENTSGAVAGFMGMNMANQAGGVNVTELMRDAGARGTKNPNTLSERNSPDAETQWICQCGMNNSLSFCPKCGLKRPDKQICLDCGYVFPAELQGMMYCPNCGHKMKETEKK